MPALVLVTRSEAPLAGYVDALRRGWSPDNVDAARVAAAHLRAVEADAGALLAGLDDPAGGVWWGGEGQVQD